MLHAHLDRTATDCDGRLDDSRVLTQTDDEKAGEFGDIEFHNRMVGSIVNTYSILSTGNLKVIRLGDAAPDVMIEWSEQTEEGYVHAVIRFCEVECDLDESSHRDHFAEMMGY